MKVSWWRSARQISGARTRGLTVILKPGYAPVEQYAGDASLDQGAYTDIYALSAVIYFAIMREPPATSIARMVKDPIVPLAERGVEGYSREFLQAIDKGLAVMAHERPQTIDAFRELLGIESSGAPRARAGNTQRFATLDRLPQPGEAAEVPPTRVVQASAPAAKGPGKHQPGPVTQNLAKPAAPAPQTWAHKTAPRWVSRAALGVSIMVIIAFGVRWLLDTPSEVMMPVVEADPGAALPDASALPPPVAAAPVAATPTPLEPAAGAANVTPAPVAAADVLQDVVLDSAPPLEEDKPAVPDTAHYRLVIKPWGTVYVDGRQKGVTPPLKKLSLPSGRHKIRIVNPNFPDFNMEVNLAKGKSGTIEHDFAANSR